MSDDLMPTATAALAAPIVTERFTIRGVDEADLDDLLVVNGDDAVTAFLPYATWRSIDDGRAWLDRIRGQEASGRSRQLVVVERASGRTIGAIVVFEYDATAGVAEFGYVLGRADWGRGAMRETLPAVVARAFDVLALRRLEAYVDVDNAASHRLLLDLGFTHEGTLRQRAFAKGRARDLAVYGLLRDEVVQDRGAKISDSRSGVPSSRTRCG